MTAFLAIEDLTFDKEHNVLVGELSQLTKPGYAPKIIKVLGSAETVNYFFDRFVNDEEGELQSAEYLAVGNSKKTGRKMPSLVLFND